MSETNSTKLLVSKKFSSFEELAEIVVAWNFDFHQLSKNHSTSSLFQLEAGHILFSYLACGCYSTHTGKAPENMYTIGLPDADCPEIKYFDHHIDQPVLLLTQPGQYFELVARPGYGMTTISVPVAVFEQFFEAYAGVSTNHLFGFKDGIIPIDPIMEADLRLVVQSFRFHTYSTSGSSASGNIVQSLESQLLGGILKSIHWEERLFYEPGMRKRSRLLKRALEFVADNRNEPLSVYDLVAATGVSERTLQRLFKREYGISPKKYLLGERMYGVHRQLWQSDLSETSVAEVINSWGFWHMGQFAKTYHDMFGELPSKTLSRSARLVS